MILKETFSRTLAPFSLDGVIKRGECFNSTVLNNNKSRLVII